MTGYTFDPDQRAYTSLSVHITDADFTAIPTTISITGNISDYSGGVADVLITFSNEAGTAITNNMGDYYHEVPYNYTGLAMPSKDNFLFTPANRSYDDLITDRTGEDYAATCTLTYLVSGTITDGTLPLEGVLVTLTGSKETTLTGSDGTYSFTVNHGYSGTITPTFANYSFTPAAITLTEVTIDSPGNNFIGTPDAYPVSGTVTWNGQPLEGVLLNFESISNDPTTASDGTYTCYVPAGWAGYIAPIKTGFTFTPSFITVPSVFGPVTGQDFIATHNPVAISGTISEDGTPLINVAVVATDDQGAIVDTWYTMSDGGFYGDVPYGFSGDITPEKANYSFTPTFRTYSNLTESVSDQDFEGLNVATYSVSGTITDGTSPLEGVTVTLTGSKETTLTGVDGTYSFIVDHGFTGTLTASFTGYSFAPSSISLTNITANSTGNDFVGNIQSCTVSGYVTLGDLTPVEGVLVHLIRPNGSSGTHTNASGYYSFANVAAGADYTVYCEMTGYTFNPVERFYPALAVNITDADFTAIPTTVTISGNIADNLGSVSDVLISFTNGGGTTTTDADGNYSHEIPYNYSGLATPSMSDYTFNPANRTYYDLIADATGEDYAATCTLTYTVSGSITDGTSPLEGVTVTLTDSKETTLTGSDGTYSFIVAHGYSGSLSASLTGYAFSPPSIALTNITANSTGNDFVGSSNAYTVSGTVTDGVFAMEGVTITLSGSKETTLTASNGSYSFTVAHGFTGTLTPSYSGYVFTPESIDLVNVTANSTSNNFVGSIGEYSVSGTVTLDGLPLEGVLVDFETITSDPVTASDGTYTCMVPTGWYGDITPALPGYTFTPEYLHLSAVSSNISGKDFNAAELSFTISGTVAEGGVPIEGVDVTFENTTKDILQVVTTASDGTYSCDVPYNWSGTATPSKTDYTFDPESKSYTNVLADVSDEDYEGYSGGLPPGWGYVNTGNNHTLNVQVTAPVIDGVPLSYGSWIGVFYTDNGVEKCAGAIEWQGAASPVIAAQGDDSTTPEKDGFSEGETITFKFYINDLKGTALYAVPNYAFGPEVYTTNGTTVISLLAAYTSITQVVPLIEGWSGISSYILPDNDSTAIIFAPVVSDLVILKSMTLAFWPPNINQIVHWNAYEGYKLKMINNQQVLFTGQDSEKTFTIPEGWSLLPVLTNQNVDVSSFFSSVFNDIIIVKSIDGMGVYWPSVGVQTLVSLEPGMAYMTKMNASGQVVFPALSAKAQPVIPGYPKAVACEAWNQPVNTGITHTLAFDHKALESWNNGDFIGVFDQTGRCTGTAMVNKSETTVVSVYGDDPMTVCKDGHSLGEAFVIMRYDALTGTTQEMMAAFLSEGELSACFDVNGLSYITELSPAVTGFTVFDAEQVMVYPIPFAENVYIRVVGSGDARFSAEAISIQGGVASGKLLFSGTGILNLTPLPPGVYLLKISDMNGNTVFKRITKQ
ncbi:MAG: hypothetical protein RBR21_08480 [Bacteroidales bacterium]|nr:hypothetical protein [Bacteroidales bacterium]